MISEQIMNVPDVSGYILKKAQSILKAAGVETITIVKTSVPSYKQAQYQSDKPVSSRVLRQKNVGDEKAVELTVGEF